MNVAAVKEDHLSSGAAVRRARGSTIEAQARAELRKSAYLAVRRTKCQLRNGVLTLRGRVPSFYLKQIAQSLIIHHLQGRVVVNNELVVEER